MGSCPEGMIPAAGGGCVNAPAKRLGGNGNNPNYYPRPKFNEMNVVKIDQHARGGRTKSRRKMHSGGHMHKMDPKVVDHMHLAYQTLPGEDGGWMRTSPSVDYNNEMISPMGRYRTQMDNASGVSSRPVGPRTRKKGGRVGRTRPKPRRKFNTGGHMHNQNQHIHSVGSGTTTGTSIYYNNSPETNPMAQTFEAGNHNHPNNTDATHRHNVMSHKHMGHDNGFWSQPAYSQYDDNMQVVDYSNFQTDNTHPHNMSGTHGHNQQLHRHMQFPNQDDTSYQVYSGMGQGPNAESYVGAGNHTHHATKLKKPNPSPRGGSGTKRGRSTRMAKKGGRARTNNILRNRRRRR